MALNKAGEATWKARYEAFGKARIDNASTAQINLRLPGQYFDAETGLHQNWNRDYVPGIGRYVQADPIGLAGGLNRYVYAESNPLMQIDPKGLQSHMCAAGLPAWCPSLVPEPPPPREKKVELCRRPFYPMMVPYARHCYIRFNGDASNTISFYMDGVHSDPAPPLMSGTCDTVSNQDLKSCVRNEMNKCKGEDWNLTKYNCCHCAEDALYACKVRPPMSMWPNYPINPGPRYDLR